MPRSMPFRPAASIAAYVRYGFASPPGRRSSIRSDEPSPTMRNPHVRLSRDQTIFTGAHDATAYRLYELMLLAMKSESSCDPASRPPKKCCMICDISPSDPSSAKRFTAPAGSQRLMWTWLEEPVQV